MSNLRRRADDFTDSLKSFHQTVCEEKQNLIVSQRDLEDTSDINSIKNRQCESDIYSYRGNNESRASIIISGRLDNQQYISSAKYKDVEDNITHNGNQSLLRDISDETSYLSLKFDLNKGILFQDEQSSKENHTFEEYSNLNSKLSEIKVNKNIDPFYLNKNKNVEVQCDLIRDRPYSVSSSSLEDDISKKNQNVTKELRRSKSCSTLNSNLKRDTNHNINASYFSVASTNTPTRKSSCKKTDITVLFHALSLSSEPFLLSNKKIDSHFTEEEDHQCDSTNSKTSSKEQLNSPELKAFSNSSEYQKLLKEQQERLLRRLSANFYNSPKTFTERLLTIIEESVMSNDSCAQLEYPEASLCRFNEEVRKMCKLIEDETIPEWPQSPSMSKSICKRRSLKSKSPSRKSLNAFTSRDKGLCLTTPPVSPRRNIKSPKKIRRRMSKNISYNVKGSLHDNTSTFESLEAFCERFYADERGVPREKNPLKSPLQSIDNILRVCENQMASLEDSLDIREELRKFQTFTPDLARQHNNEVPEEQNLQYRLLTQEKCNKTNLKKVPDTFKQWTGRNKSYEMIEPDDLENTLMYEIAKKRQRCLDTAKVMMEIDTNSEPGEAQNICPKIVISEASSTSDAKFIETLMSVKRYQEYLEEHKSILNSFQTGSCSAFSTLDKKYIRTKEISREDVGTHCLGDKVKIATLEVPTMRKKSTRSSSPKCSNNITVSKPKLFLTPGKTPTKKSCKSKRTYFPNLVGGMNKEKKLNADVSPHPKNIYQQLENYDHVVSPVGLYIKGTDPHLIKNLRPKTDEKLLTPRKKQIKRSPSPKLKFQLSPKLPKKTVTRTVGDENIADNFLHPKVHYKLPSHVRTIKETEDRKVGNRVNELLRSTQNKVVVRHKGRIKSVQTNCSKQPEIHYDSAEESVHVEQTARKTYFSRVQKN